MNFRLTSFKYNFGYLKLRRGSWKKTTNTTRKSQYILDEDAGPATTLSLQEHARIQAASRYQSTLKQASTTLVDSTSTVFQTGAKSDSGEGKITRQFGFLSKLYIVS